MDQSKKILTLNLYIHWGRLRQPQNILRHALVPPRRLLPHGLDGEARLGGQHVPTGPAPGDRGGRVALGGAAQDDRLPLPEDPGLVSAGDGSGREHNVEGLDCDKVLVECVVLSDAHDLGAVVVPGDGEDQAGDRPPGAVLCLGVLLGLLGPHRFVGDDPGQFWGRVTAGRHTLEVQVLAGATRNGAGVYAVLSSIIFVLGSS